VPRPRYCPADRAVLATLAGLREPQIGGVHAVLGHWATRSH
jgi:hypothetical protein